MFILLFYLKQSWLLWIMMDLSLPFVAGQYVVRHEKVDSQGSASFNNPLFTLVGYEKSSRQLQPKRHEQLSHPDDSNITLGESLYTCAATPSMDGVPGCNTANGSARLPSVPVIREIIKSTHSSIVTVVLTVQVQRVNFFSLHYASLHPSLTLSPTLQLPSTFDSNVTEVWTFNGKIPGPTIRARVGDVLRIQFHNSLPVATSLFIPGVFVS